MRSNLEVLIVEQHRFFFFNKIPRPEINLIKPLNVHVKRMTVFTHFDVLVCFLVAFFIFRGFFNFLVWIVVNDFVLFEFFEYSGFSFANCINNITVDSAFLHGVDCRVKVEMFDADRASEI